MIRRGCAAALALWFLAGGVGDAVGAHHCPHHDGVPPASRTDHPGHDGQAVHPGAHDQGDAPADAHGPCTCVGRCHAGAAPAFAPPAVLRIAPVAAMPELSVAAPAAPSRPAIVPYALPWGNAPPAL